MSEEEIQQWSEEWWFRRRNHFPWKYEGRIDPKASMEDIRKRYNRGRYWIIITDEGTP